jgi:hypothetical protein
MLTLRRGLAASRGLRRFSTKPTLTPPANLSEGEKLIYDKLTDKFLPTELAVQDISGGTLFPLTQPPIRLVDLTDTVVYQEAVATFMPSR